jgi:hypothetical protein
MGPDSAIQITRKRIRNTFIYTVTLNKSLQYLDMKTTKKSTNKKIHGKPHDPLNKDEKKC